MSKVTFDYSKAASFISEEEVGYMSKLVDNAKKELLDKKMCIRDRYYRFTEGRAQVVAGVFMHPGFVLETEKLQAIQTKLQELFLHPEGRIPGCEQNMAIYQVELLLSLIHI